MTINEIAKLAGVSRTTVSRYLNHGYVSEEKSERIRKIIEETGYQPSRQAQVLRTKKSKFIAVILPKINSDSISREVAGISSVLNQNGYEIILANTNNHEQDELKYLRIFSSNGTVDGVILIGTILTPEHLELIRSYPLPIVLLGQNCDLCSCVYFDDYKAAKKLTSLLAETGRQIGYIGATDRDLAAGRARRQGFTDALTEAGREVNPDWMKTCEFKMESGYSAAEELFACNPGIDSLFCGTDNMAIGAMLYLREHGYSIPDQVQIVGIGDSEKAHIVQPTLMTVHNYYRTSGKEIARLLLGILSGREAIRRNIKMGYKLIAGGSVRGIEEDRGDSAVTSRLFAADL